MTAAAGAATICFAWATTRRSTTEPNERTRKESQEPNFVVPSASWAPATPPPTLLLPHPFPKPFATPREPNTAGTSAYTYLFMYETSNIKININAAGLSRAVQHKRPGCPVPFDMQNGSSPMLYNPPPPVSGENPRAKSRKAQAHRGRAHPNQNIQPCA